MRLYFTYLTAAVVSATVSAQGEKQLTEAQSSTVDPAQASSSVAVSASAPRAEAVGEVPADYRLEDLPAAVQKTAGVVAQRDAHGRVLDIDREVEAGYVIWEIEFEQKDGYSEIYIDQNGILIPEPGAIDFTVTQPVPTGGSGAPAGVQFGHRSSSVGPRWEDLPEAVQKRALDLGPKETIADIDREAKVGRFEYEIEFRREGRNLEIQFAEDGTIKESNDPKTTPVDAAPNSPGGSAAVVTGLQTPD